MKTITIRPFDNKSDRGKVVALWQSVLGYNAPHNHPELSIDKKLAVDDQLFLVALSNDEVVGTVMAGYDGHRGWLYSVAVSPAHRRKRIGSRLVAQAERNLIELGCVKINLQIADGNEQVSSFYETLGYSIEKRVSMGKRISQNVRSM